MKLTYKFLTYTAIAALSISSAYASTTGTVMGPQAGPNCTSWFVNGTQYALQNNELNNTGISDALNVASNKGTTVQVFVASERGANPALDYAVCQAVDNGAHNILRPYLVVPLN